PRELDVVGAGPAGLRFAATAAERGHYVRLFDASDEPGGRINVLKRLPTRGSWQGAIDNLLRRCERAGVELEFASEVRAGAAGGDTVVVATGATWTTTGYSPYRPERKAIPGHDQTFVIDIATAISRALEDPGGLGRRVMLLDETGDYLPLGLAELLGEAGVEVEILTPRPFVGADTQRTLDMPHVLPRLKKLGVTTTAQHFVESIGTHSVTVYDVWGGAPAVREEVDTLVMAMTRLPHDALYHELVTAGVDAVRVGDVVAPRRLEAIIYEAEDLARSI
ncbi:MAG: NAD(P)-binding protein, partial [Gammaproteobacteria bacterium]